MNVPEHAIFGDDDSYDQICGGFGFGGGFGRRRSVLRALRVLLAVRCVRSLREGW